MRAPKSYVSYILRLDLIVLFHRKIFSFTLLKCHYHLLFLLNCQILFKIFYVFKYAVMKVNFCLFLQIKY